MSRLLQKRTVDMQVIGEWVEPNSRVLDLGCGAGRHAFEALRRGASVVALDADEGELRGVADMVAAMAAAGEVPAGADARTVRGDATRMPFPDGAFDRVIALGL